MKKIFHITEPQQIKSLLGLIHDWFFDVGKIIHNKTTNTVTIVFWENRKDFLKPKNSIMLTIFNVKQIKIKDTENVGYYDLNKIIYDNATQIIKITCGIPLGVEIFTNGLMIEANTLDLNEGEICMKNQQTLFKPDLIDAKLEFRVENNVICIYGTPEGFQWLIEQCHELMHHSKKVLCHIHIDRSIPPEVLPCVLTEKSLEAIIFIFSPSEKSKNEKSKRSIWRFIFKRVEEQFDESKFSNAELEFGLNMEKKREIIYITGTQKGLLWFIDQCKILIDEPEQGHVHIDKKHDMSKILTKQSLEVTIAIF